MSEALDINNVFSPLTPDEMAHAANVYDRPADEVQEIVCPAPPDAPEPRFWHPSYGQPSRTWTYSDSAGAVLGYVCRFDPPNERKQIIPYTLWQDERG